MCTTRSRARACIVGLASVAIVSGLTGCPRAPSASAPARRRRAYLDSAGAGVEAPAATEAAAVPAQGLGRPNTLTDFNPDVDVPRIDPTAFVDPMASVIGDVTIGRRVFVAPMASIRGDEGQPIHVGDESNVQDGVVIHALETEVEGHPQIDHIYQVEGEYFAVYVGPRVSLAHQSQVHGPAWIEHDVFVGMQSMVFHAHIGAGSVIEPSAVVMGVAIPPGRNVRCGTVVRDQATADALPEITESYTFRTINRAVIHVNTSLADGYSGRGSAAPEHEESAEGD